MNRGLSPVLATVFVMRRMGVLRPWDVVKVAYGM
jgi:hypothetical protein